MPVEKIRPRKIKPKKVTDEKRGRSGQKKINLLRNARKFKSTPARKRAASKFYYWKNKYKNNYERIARVYSRFESIPDPTRLSIRGLSTTGIKRKTMLLRRLLDLKGSVKFIKERWREYMECMEKNQQNKHSDYLKYYGKDPSIDVIISVFEDPHFKPCNAFESSLAREF